MKLLLPLLLFILPTLALAQAPSTSVIPYQGTLFSQGKPVSQNTPVKMAFALYSSDAGFPADQRQAPSANRKWRSWEDGGDQVNSNTDTVNVHVRNGRFLVHLGEESDGHQPLEESVFDTRPLYVVTWVVNSSGTFRLPPQKLEKVPHAVTAERATSFEVKTHLNVIGDADIGGTLRVNNLVIDNGIALAPRRVVGEPIELSRGSGLHNAIASCDPDEVLISGGCSRSSAQVVIYQ